jgi:hypothetical protein
MFTSSSGGLMRVQVGSFVVREVLLAKSGGGGWLGGATVRAWATARAAARLSLGGGGGGWISSSESVGLFGVGMAKKFSGERLG